MEFGANPSQESGGTAVAGGFEFPDFSVASAPELLGLMAEVDSVRRRAEGYLVGLVVRYGELEGRSAASTVCHQLGISAYKARQLAKTAGGLAAMPDVLSAVQQGHISSEQGGMVADSHKRAPRSGQDQQDLLALGGWQSHDEFKKSVVADEDRRRAAPLRRQNPKGGHQNPAAGPLPQRPRLRGLRPETAGLRGPPHRSLGRRRSHQHRQPRIALSEVPQQSPQTQALCRTLPRHGPIHAPTTTPAPYRPPPAVSAAPQTTNRSLNRLSRAASAGSNLV